MPKCRTAALISGLLFCFCATLLAAGPKPRARDLGVPFDGKPGPLNAITDVKGVEVGHTTLISGEGALKVGTGPVRTGVTAVLPRGKDSKDQVFAGWFTLNGNGEMTGTTWVEESGFLEGPVMITNTHSVGVVRDAVIAWRVDPWQTVFHEYAHQRRCSVLPALGILPPTAPSRCPQQSPCRRRIGDTRSAGHNP